LRSLRTIVRTLDDDALAALANKGLLRRAQKDLEGAQPAIVAAEADFLTIQIVDATVEVPELPAKSKCTCPATGVCRHILAALVWLRDAPELAAFDAPLQGELFKTGGDSSVTRSVSEGAPQTTASPADVFAGLTDEELQKWAGRALFKKALKALAATPNVEINAGQTLVVRFPTRNLTCRWIPSGGLLGMVCSCQAETVCEHVVTAVLAYQVSLGKRAVAHEQRLLEESSGSPRTRAEVLEGVGSVLREMVALGFARLSVSTAERLTTLAISAHGVDLPRLKAMLAGLGAEIQLALRRDAQASTPAILWQAARIEALRTALSAAPLPALVGEHRTSYHEVGQLTLAGLGAQHWRSKGGYHGITLYFWDESAKGWATWTDARPAGQAGFHPVGRYRAEGPWSGCESPQQASRSIVRLSGAYRNAQGRISGRPGMRGLVTGPTPLRTACEKGPGIVVKWSDLAARVRKLFGGGLADRGSNLDLVVVAPTSWGPSHYDTLRQELTRPIVDEAGRILELWLPFTPESAPAVELVEKHDPAQTWGIFGSLRLIAGRVRLQPISLFVADKPLHVNLDQAPAAPAENPKSVAAEIDEEVLQDEEEVLPQLAAGTATALSRLLVTAQAELEAFADNGLLARRDLELLSAIAKRLDALGLAACARPLARLAESLASAARQTDQSEQRFAAGKLLHAYYVLRLATDQEAVAAATAGLG
jgi:hypothetical protein